MQKHKEKNKRPTPNVDQQCCMDDFKARKLGKRIRINTLKQDRQGKVTGFKPKDAKIVSVSPADPDMQPDLVAVHVETDDGESYTVFHKVNNQEQHYEELD